MLNSSRKKEILSFMSVFCSRLTAAENALGDATDMDEEHMVCHMYESSKGVGESIAVLWFDEYDESFWFAIGKASYKYHTAEELCDKLGEPGLLPFAKRIDGGKA